MGFWAFMDVALLAAGAIMVAFSQIFAAPNLLINIALRPDFLMGESSGSVRSAYPLSPLG